ncbi:hypothetical protein KEM55_003191, partial [Ascosphaera atra]
IATPVVPIFIHLHCIAYHRYSPEAYAAMTSTPQANQGGRATPSSAETARLSNSEIVEVRAAQRTFEGAYMRTALSQLSFALVVLKIFTREFYSIGALFAAYGAGIFVVALLRRGNCKRSESLCKCGGECNGTQETFRTSGTVVLMLSVLSLAAYVAMLTLTLRL